MKQLSEYAGQHAGVSLTTSKIEYCASDSSAFAGISIAIDMPAIASGFMRLVIVSSVWVQCP
jgi:hypothetical protein